jgi:hypothetical protein
MLELTNLQQHFVSMRRVNALRDTDPLRYWHHSSAQSKEATRLLLDWDEVYCRAANLAGKTNWEYATGLAMLQKRPELDGVPLPQWRGKIEAVSLELDYTIERLSSQQAIMSHLGDWPHKPVWHAQTLTALSVMPFGGNDDSRKWSTLTFMSQKNLATGTGVRADLILANEPPRQDIWEEIRKAGHAGRPIKRIIGATPIKRSQWYWLREQYGKDCPRDGIRLHHENKWAEVRWSLDANRALTPEKIAILKADYAKNPALYDARVYGDYCDASGKCPFDEMTLIAMLKDPNWAREPIDITEWRIPREKKDGTPVTDTTVPVEVFAEKKQGSKYYLPMDLASGIDDILHDWAGLLVTEFGSGDLQAQFTAPMEPYRMGILAAGLGRVGYGDAQVQPERNEWSLGTLQALADARYPNIGHENRALENGEWIREPGFRTDQKTRGAMISAIQAWIEAYRVGAPYARPSKKIVECLLDTILDEKNRPVAGPGSRDELMILWGQSLLKTVSNRGLEVRKALQPPKDPNRMLVEMVQGKGQNDNNRWASQTINPPRRAPKV